MKKILQITMLLLLVNFTAANAQVKNLTSVTQLNRILSNMRRPIIIDFYADWCGPCQRYKPVFESVARQKQGVADFYRVNGDQARDLMNKYEITSYPTTLIICANYSSGGYFKQVGYLCQSELIKGVNMGVNKYRSLH